MSIPHTWNAADPFDDVQGYRRGVAWYRRQLVVPDSLKGRRLFLHFEGVNQGVLIPDHTPEMTCGAPWRAGMAYALGYMRAALQAVERL